MYFSCTGTTETLAEYAVEFLNADLYEIVPQEPYTDDDLNYNDSNSRANIEQNDVTFRPMISGSIENMEQYETVVLAYPIWWGRAPRIMSTFLESYDFSGKTIVPFCTSGSSGIGSSATDLVKLTQMIQIGLPADDSVEVQPASNWKIGCTALVLLPRLVNETAVLYLADVCSCAELDKAIHLFVNKTRT